MPRKRSIPLQSQPPANCELVLRRTAEEPNAMWQADHTVLDIIVLAANGKPARPWLTVVLDDCSRTVCGYAMFLGLHSHPHNRSGWPSPTIACRPAPLPALQDDAGENSSGDGVDGTARHECRRFVQRARHHPSDPLPPCLAHGRTPRSGAKSDREALAWSNTCALFAWDCCSSQLRVRQSACV